MIDRAALKADLIQQVKLAEVDLEAQARAVREVADRFDAEYKLARENGRTAQTKLEWLGERITQAAVAWVLGTVFVRFCEDNGLIPDPYITSPDPERRDLAQGRYDAYVEADDDPTYRGWLTKGFDELGQGEAGKLLFDQKHNALYQIPISHDGAGELLEFWRRRDESGELVHDFTDPLNEDGTEGWDTRFLGDLYQDLSEDARERYALLQTPEFVEEFILDRTMTPALNVFGYEELKMIDPTCGSGHFVLGAFKRLVRIRGEQEPHRELHERVRAALDSVHGVDLNPFAVAIARFRLLLAAMAVANIRTLAHANKYEWPIHLAIGDSLLKARQLEVDLLGETSGDQLADFSYATEDKHEHPGILEEGRYHVVVGNPPYVTVKDKQLNAAYRELYKSCAGTYSLSVPFAERFFQLAYADPTSDKYGYVGQITANSFMKREFGKPLIEQYFAHKVELTEVIDTSGAYIPGHGTPTVILVGRRRSGFQKRSGTVRAVRSVQGEPSAPEVPAEGKVWRAIVDQIDKPDSVSQWVSVGDLERHRYFGKHPWVMADGGLEMLAQIEKAATRQLRADLARDIGFASFPGQDEAFIADRESLVRRRVRPHVIKRLVVGEVVRDWSEYCVASAIVPYAPDLEPLPYDPDAGWGRALWPLRVLLMSTTDFGGVTQQSLGKPWWSWYRWVADRYRTPSSISFAEVATHNHFVLDRGGSVFKQTAPVIKLKRGATEEAHLRLLGLLNSAAAAYWLKQVCHDKGIRGEGGGFTSGDWERFYQFNGSNVAEFPLPAEYPTELATELDSLAQQLSAVLPSELELPTAENLRTSREAWHRVRARMIALQEELDWQVYKLYDLLPEDLRAPLASVPELNLGERAFEIVLARKVAAGEASGEWFKRHNSTPLTAIPAHWPEAYQATVQRRIDAIESSRAINMIERPEYKRRWQTDGWDALQVQALRSWLLTRMEDRSLWFEDDSPRIQTLAHLTDDLSRDADFVSVAALYSPRTELADVVASLIEKEHVPFLAALRYKPSGLKKRAAWEHVWEQQRAEDAEPSEPKKRQIRDRIPVPPKYGQADFVKPSYWTQRGKLDVPKERFISYGSALSPLPTRFGWAGWNHLEQATAIATYLSLSSHLIEPAEAAALLAGLLELQPWLDQWHGELDPAYGTSQAEIIRGFRAEKQGEYGLTEDDLRAWRPVAGSRPRPRARQSSQTRKSAAPAAKEAVDDVSGATVVAGSSSAAGGPRVDSETEEAD